MSIITLTTDFGHKDYFVSVIKAALLQEAPASKVIDISHEISPFNHRKPPIYLKMLLPASQREPFILLG